MTGDYYLDQVILEARLREAAERRRDHERRRLVRASRRRLARASWRRLARASRRRRGSGGAPPTLELQHSRAAGRSDPPPSRGVVRDCRCHAAVPPPERGQRPPDRRLLERRTWPAPCWRPRPACASTVTGALTSCED